MIRGSLACILCLFVVSCAADRAGSASSARPVPRDLGTVAGLEREQYAFIRSEPVQNASGQSRRAFETVYYGARMTPMVERNIPRRLCASIGLRVATTSALPGPRSARTADRKADARGVRIVCG